VLNLKDAFFCIPLGILLGLLHSIVGKSCQIRIFKPIFSESLATELWNLQLNQGALLQYVVIISDPGHCLANTIIVLSHFSQCGYKVSPEKTQIC
jgi:hypothetical protein